MTIYNPGVHLKADRVINLGTIILGENTLITGETILPVENFDPAYILYAELCALRITDREGVPHIVAETKSIVLRPGMPINLRTPYGLVSIETAFDEGAYSFTLVGADELYISKLELQPDFYTSRLGWLNPDNPDNLLDKIEYVNFNSDKGVKEGGLYRATLQAPGMFIIDGSKMEVKLEAGGYSVYSAYGGYAHYLTTTFKYAYGTGAVQFRDIVWFFCPGGAGFVTVDPQTRMAIIKAYSKITVLNGESYVSRTQNAESPPGYFSRLFTRIKSSKKRKRMGGVY